MGRNFASRQLIEVETELADLAGVADELGMVIGESADSVHYDGVVPPPSAAWLETVRQLRYKLDRAEGLIRAYDIHVNKGVS